MVNGLRTLWLFRRKGDLQTSKRQGTEQAKSHERHWKCSWRLSRSKLSTRRIYTIAYMMDCHLLGTFHSPRSPMPSEQASPTPMFIIYVARIEDKNRFGRRGEKAFLFWEVGARGGGVRTFPHLILAGYAMRKNGSEATTGRLEISSTCKTVLAVDFLFRLVVN